MKHFLIGLLAGGFKRFIKRFSDRKPLIRRAIGGAGGGVLESQHQEEAGQKNEMNPS
jgi:hypothetical protein